MLTTSPLALDEDRGGAAGDCGCGWMVVAAAVAADPKPAVAVADAEV